MKPVALRVEPVEPTRQAVEAPSPEGSTARMASDMDREFCAEMLPKVSRTFALSITALPESLRDAVRVAYLLCRIVDTVEDDAQLCGENRERLFDLFDLLMVDDRADTSPFERLSTELGIGAGTEDQRLCVGAGAVFRCFRALVLVQRTAIRPHVLEMSRGMREYTHQADRVGKLRLRDLEELERYCYFVAGTVGKLLTALFESEVPGLSRQVVAGVRARAVSFGLALQMVNIVKDVAADHQRGDCFLPEELAKSAGVSLDDILEPSRRDAGLMVVRAVCGRAREHLRRAEEYTMLWPVDGGRQVRLFCTVPLALALATLREVEHGADTLVVGKTPKVSREMVVQLFADANVAIERNDTLRWMLSYYASGGSGAASDPPPPSSTSPLQSSGPRSTPTEPVARASTREDRDG
jgi:farnesyl-diphosphate farnesyltransferase